jgi:hypothetical protein
LKERVMPKSLTIIVLAAAALVPGALLSTTAGASVVPALSGPVAAAFERADPAPMVEAQYGTSRRVARRTSRRTSRRN